MTVIYTLLFVLLISCNENGKDKSDKGITINKIEPVMADEYTKFKYHLQIIQPDRKMDSKILKKIEEIEKYKIIAIDPTKRKVEKYVTKKIE